MFSTGGDRCPVALFSEYVSRRPLSIRNSGRFYLTPKPEPKDDVWYTSVPVGKKRVNNFMESIVSETGIVSAKKVTNHSGRITLVRKLKAAKVPESSIIKITGHTTPAGLRSYDPADEQEFRGMSNVVNGRHVQQQHQPFSMASIMNGVSTFNKCILNFGATAKVPTPPRKIMRLISFSDYEIEM